METATIFAERLRGLRGANRMSQRVVARGLGITPQAYQCYECGRKLPMLEKLPTLADFFGVSIDYLLGRVDDPHMPTKDELALIKQMRSAYLDVAK